MNPHRIAIVAAIIGFIQSLVFIRLGIVGITILASIRSELGKQ